MGYEVAGAMGIKMAGPDWDGICTVGDGSYMMANSELATATMMGIPFTVVFDKRGYGCINRLLWTGGVEFNSFPRGSRGWENSRIDCVSPAAVMGVIVIKAGSVGELEAALAWRHEASRRGVIDLHPYSSAPDCGHWWDVAVPEVFERREARESRTRHEEKVGERT